MQTVVTSMRKYTGCVIEERKTAWNMKPKESSIWNLIFKVRMESREGAGHVMNWCSLPGWGNP